ncbi:hypothetical protein V5T82_13740, partial [Magnetovibrio sp. PR-2]|uniref:hypothetical protein n=1 Tax=Magnetovibrio sp. PR-2 TaxID=3120356 RepID=UPI002FCE2850
LLRSSRQREMHGTDQETPSKSVSQNGHNLTCPLKRSMERAYSHRGHGPRADQTGRIHISDFRNPAIISIAKCSRSIHMAIFHQISGHFNSSAADGKAEHECLLSLNSACVLPNEL